jgi:hypothetical protein
MVLRFALPVLLLEEVLKFVGRRLDQKNSLPRPEDRSTKIKQLF